MTSELLSFSPLLLGEIMDTASLDSSDAGSSRFMTLFNFNDPRERFVAAWVWRFHSLPPQFWKALAFKRAAPPDGSNADRLLYELASWRKRPRCYAIVTWNIDKMRMDWREVTGRRAAVQVYQQLK